MNAQGQEVVFDLTTGAPTGYTPLFAPPEVLTNVNNVQGLQSNTPGQAQVGNLGLSASQEADLVNFLKILSDGYTAPNPVGRRAGDRRRRHPKARRPEPEDAGHGTATPADRRSPSRNPRHQPSQ